MGIFPFETLNYVSYDNAEGGVCSNANASIA